jgi:hypothetical protein
MPWGTGENQILRSVDENTTENTLNIEKYISVTPLIGG